MESQIISKLNIFITTNLDQTLILMSRSLIWSWHFHVDCLGATFQGALYASTLYLIKFQLPVTSLMTQELVNHCALICLGSLQCVCLVNRVLAIVNTDFLSIFFLLSFSIFCFSPTLGKLISMGHHILTEIEELNNFWPGRACVRHP